MGHQKGFIGLILILLTVVLVGAGVYFSSTRQTLPPPTIPLSDSASTSNPNSTSTSTTTPTTTSTTSTPTLTPKTDRVTVSGRFVVLFGDPPPDSGQPAQRRYSLTDEQGQQWTLTFDASVYSPPGGILTFNGKQVEVLGKQTEANHLLVESMRLL